MPVRNTDEYRDLAVEQLRESPTNHAVASTKNSETASRQL